MKSRNKLLVLFRVAAPGSYDVEKVDKTLLQSSPAYSFGQKHKDLKPDDIPGKCLFGIFYTSTALPMSPPDYSRLKVNALTESESCYFFLYPLFPNY